MDQPCEPRDRQVARSVIWLIRPAAQKRREPCGDIAAEYRAPGKDAAVGQEGFRIVGAGTGGVNPTREITAVVGQQTHALGGDIDPMHRIVGVVGEA